MLFLFNQTGEDLKLRCYPQTQTTVDGETVKETTIGVEFPNKVVANILHTADSGIQKAIDARFKLRVMEVPADRKIVGHDFYIHKKVTGYDLKDTKDNCMIEMLPCSVNPSEDKDTVRNLVLGIFKREDGKKSDMFTYDTNDTTLVKVDQISATLESGETVTYEFHWLAIKWAGWFRLKRPAWLLVQNNTDTLIYKFSTVDSKLRANVRNDWLVEATEEERKTILDNINGVSNTKSARINTTREASTPVNRKQTWSKNSKPRGEGKGQSYGNGGYKKDNNRTQRGGFKSRQGGSSKPNNGKYNGNRKSYNGNGEYKSDDGYRSNRGKNTR